MGTLERLRPQRGFTLIELLAVMAIIAVLVAIVAPAVSGTKNSSTEAQAIQDGLQVRTAATSYFQDQNSTEVLTSPSAFTTLAVKVGQTTGTTYSDSAAATSTVTATQQKSSRWPEKFITSTATSTDSVYYLEFPTTGSTVLDTVYVVDSDNKLIGVNDLLDGYTAIDIDTLVSSTSTYLEEKPKSGDLKTDLNGDGTTTSDPHTFLWFFKKTKSAGSSAFDSREVKVFKLESAIKNSAGKYNLKYVQIF